MCELTRNTELAHAFSVVLCWLREIIRFTARECVRNDRLANGKLHLFRLNKHSGL